MATQVQSSRNLVGMQSIAFIRAITLTLRLTSARPKTPMNVFFDGVLVNQFCAPLGGAIGQSLISDTAGAITITFSIPGGRFSTGTKQIIVTDSGSIDSLSQLGSTFGSARANFTSTGVSQIFQETTTITQINSIVVEQVLPAPVVQRQTGQGGRGHDPLAQSFFTYGIKGGCYLTSIDLYFNTKDTSIPVRVDIRPMINGLPQSYEPEDSRYVCVLPAASVNTSTNSSVATNFKFDVPVYLEEDKDYCFVVFSNSKQYNLFTSKLGEKSIETGRVIFEQPYNGSMFKSENNITWQPEQFEDIKFNLNIAKFSTSTNGVVKLKAVSDFFGVSGQYITTTAGQPIVRVQQTVQHGLEVNSKVFVVADTGATYNGIAATNLAGQRNVVSITDEYTFSFTAGANASSTGQILTGGQLREIQIDNGGTGYTSAPTISFTGGGGTGAAATAYISNGSIVRIEVTLKGSGYTSEPTITLAGGGGSGAVLVPIIEAGFLINTNKPTNFVVSNVPAYAAPDAKVSAKITTTQLNYVGGNLNTYSPAEVLDMSIRGRTYLNTNSVIASGVNEVDRMGGNPSTLIEYSLSTTNPNVSPLIDLGNSPSLISYNYKIRSQVGEDLAANTSTGVVSQVSVLNFGSGYNVAPTVTFVGESTAPATAVALLGTTAVSAVTVTAPGTGYTTAPTVAFSGGGGTGALATAVLAGTGIASVTVTSAGSGYTTPPDIVVSGGGGGTGAELTAVLNSVGVASATISSGGTGYTTPPTAIFTGGGGTGATATVLVSGGEVVTITITDPGTGYTSAPTMSFTGGGGTGATATAVLELRQVASITVTNAGSGYTTVPGLLFSGGGGTGAAGTPVLAPRGVASVTLTNGGSGYTSAPTVSFSGGDGTGVTATTSIAGRSISTIIITDPGTNYSTPPEVVITRTDGSTGVDAIATSVLTTFNSELSVNRGTALSRYVTKKFTLETPSTGINLFSEIYSEQQSGVDWYIRTSKSGTTQNHDDLEWKILACDVERNRSSKRGEVFDYKFYLYGLQEFDVYDLKCVLRSSNPAKAPEVNNYRAIIVA